MRGCIYGIILSAILIGLTFALTSCMKSPVSDQVVSKQVHYFQDKRTHLCYAYWAESTGCFTMVPCNQVSALLDNDWSR